MKCQGQEPVGSALVEYFCRHICEQSFYFIGWRFFDHPDLSSLMHRKKGVAAARHLAEPNQSITHVARFVNKRMRKAQFLAEKWPQGNRLCELRDIRWHAAIAR